MCETVVLDADRTPGAGGISTSVVSGIATVSDVEPTALEFRLGDYVDADALEELIAHGSDRSVATELRFHVEEYEVVVSSAGDVVVTRPCDAPEDCRTARA